MSDELKAQELENLKMKATDLGVSFHPSISAEKLSAKIKAHLEEEVKEEVVQDKKVQKSFNRAEALKDATKLIRVRVTCMNPNKRDWPGEIFTVSNNLVGTVRKYVPFTGDEYHVPNFIYKTMKNRKYRTLVEKPDGKGGKIASNRFVPEFNIEVLPQLTKKELEQLALEQAKRGNITDD